MARERDQAGEGPWLESAAVDVPVAYSPDAKDLAARLGFDPYAGTGVLNRYFSAGVHSPADTDREHHELAAAQAFADEGADVRLTLEDHSRTGVQSIDAWVRWAGDDDGVATELKSLRDAENLSRASKGHIIKAGKQLTQQAGTSAGVANGQVLVDGRYRGLTAADAARSLDRAIGQANDHGQTLPGKVVFLLGDERILVFRPAVLVGADGSRNYKRPDGAALSAVGRDDVGWSTMWRNRWPR